MRKPTLTVVAIAAFSAAASPAWAQEPAPSPDGAVPSAEMTPERLSAYSGWSEEQRSQYDAWPANTQAYYWSLSPPRQEVFWRISDNDKLALTAMSEDDRASAWDLVEQKMLSDDPATVTAPQEDADPPVPADDADGTIPSGLPDDKAEPEPRD